jgi:RND family efflux transporter MFP subunit
MEERAEQSPKPKIGSAGRPWLRRGVPILFILLLLTLIGSLVVKIQSKAEIIKAQNQAKMKKGRPAPNVMTLKLVPTTIRDQIDLPGVTQPWVKLQMVVEVAGSITGKAVKEGADVNKGDVLVTIDSRDYRNALRSAKAAYDLAVSELKRQKALNQRKVAPQSQLDTAVAQVESTRAAMDNARIALERCTIRAPFPGVVNRILVEPGQYLAVGDPVAELLQIDRLKVRVGIPESDVDAVRRIDCFKVKIDALGGKEFEARKYFLSKTADPMARLYSLDLTLDNAQGIVLPDMFTRVEIIKKEVAEGLSIPLYSVINRNKDRVVYIVEDSRARVRTVELGLLDGWQVQVRAGLTRGEEVIVVGHRSVNDGQQVNVVRSVTSPEDIVK